MFIKIILAICLMIMLFGGSTLSGFSINSFKTSAQDKEIEANTTILDKAIVSWYCNHSGEVPSSLSSDMIKMMGLEDMDVSHFTYTKVSDNTFTLTANLSNKKKITSANSNKALPQLATYGDKPAT